MTPVFSAARSRADGASPKTLSRLVEAGVVERLRRGWYATSDVTPDIRRAVSAGGIVTCVSALSARGLWTMPHTDLHVLVASGIDVRRRAGIRLHWTHDRIDLARSIDDVESALLVAVSCLDLRAAVVVVDSALNRGVIAPRTLERLFSASPGGRRVLAVADGRAESGIETLARLGLRRLRLRVRSQVVIPGVGRVDLLIGDRLILEVDGRQWHTDFEADRARDRRLVALGYLLIRASYRQILEEWDVIAEQVATLVRRNEHRWRTTLPQGARRRPDRPE
jgi:very-short-patch-repair endonuclease